MKKRLETIVIMMVGLILYKGFALASIPKQGGLYEIITDGVCLGGIPGTSGGNYNLIYAIAQPEGVGTFTGGGFILYTGYISQLDISGPVEPPVIPQNLPHITSISPQYGINTERVRVHIKGENFSEGADVKLVRARFSDIDGYGVEVTLPDSIRCIFDLSNQAYGLWDVVVRNNNGQSGTMPGGFSICLPLIYDTLGGSATGSDNKTKIEVSPNTFGEDVYMVIDSNYTSNEITIANQLDDLDINTVRINNGIIKFMPYSVLSVEITGNLGKEATITLPYNDMNGNGIVYNTHPLIKERHLKIGELAGGRWRAIGDSVVYPDNDTVSGKVNQLSAYALLGISQLGANLSRAHPYPVPFRANRNKLIIFTGLPGNVEIKIYDIAGDLVTTLKEQDMDGEFEWNVTNDNGDKVCSGVYIYLMKDEQGKKKTGRLVIIR